MTRKRRKLTFDEDDSNPSPYINYCKDPDRNHGLYIPVNSREVEVTRVETENKRDVLDPVLIRTTSENLEQKEPLPDQPELVNERESSKDLKTKKLMELQKQYGLRDRRIELVDLDVTNRKRHSSRNQRCCPRLSARNPENHSLTPTNVPSKIDIDLEPLKLQPI